MAIGVVIESTKKNNLEGEHWMSWGKRDVLTSEYQFNQ